MQMTPLFQSMMHLAGHMAARACQSLGARRPVGVDFGRVHAELRLEAEANPACFEGALANGRALLDQPPPGCLAVVLLHAGCISLPDGTQGDAILAECRVLATATRGLTMAIPYVPANGKQEPVFFPAFVHECPAELDAQADDLLRDFAHGLSSHEIGSTVWLNSLTWPRGAWPGLPSPEERRCRFAAAIDPDDPRADCDTQVAVHLETFLAGGEFEGGLGFGRSLRALPLDFSLGSLSAVDALIDRVREERRPRREVFLGSRAARNFLNLLSFYTGETLAAATGASTRWLTHEQLERAEPGRLAAEMDADTSMVCLFNAQVRGSDLAFLAVDVIAARLFGDPQAPTITAAVAAALPDVRATSVPPANGMAEAWMADREHRSLEFPWPEGMADDALRAWHGALPRLARNGRVCWARLVQAHQQMFRPGVGDHQGEVVFDPRGRLDTAMLDRLGQALFELKGTRPRHPGLAWLAAHLTEARTTGASFPVPASLGARGARVASLVLHRAHLPGGRLSGQLLPVVVSDDVPGMVAVLPERYWPAALRAQWLRAPLERVPGAGALAEAAAA